jgi:hypothetical protein
MGQGAFLLPFHPVTQVFLGEFFSVSEWPWLWCFGLWFQLMGSHVGSRPSYGIVMCRPFSPSPTG